MAIITPDSDEFRSAMADLTKKDNNPSKDTVTPTLEKINGNLVKILETIKKGEGIRPKGTKDEEEEKSIKDELKSLFVGIKTFGKGIKESVKSTYNTKPDAAPIMSSAEALEAKDTLAQPKQVEVDQLKVAEETKDTQKEILTELKKLNQTTEEKGSGSSGGSVDVNLGTPGAEGKPKGKLGKAMSVLGKAAKFAGPLAAAGVAAYEGVSGWQQAGENFDLKEGEKATLGQKASSALGGIASGMTFGLIDSKKASKGIHSFFGGNKKEGESTQSSAETPTPTSTPSAAPSATKVGGAVAATASKSSSPKKSSVQQEMEGDDNLEKLEMAKAELQGLQEDYRDEKRKVSQELLKSGKYPEGFSDFKGKPNYPEELKAVDQKYEPLIQAQKKEIEKLSKAPGIKEAKAREDSFDKEIDGETKDTLSKASPKETFSKTTTSTDTTTTGGGSTTTKRVRSADAEAAQKEMTALEGKHEEEKQQVVSKLKAEGKVGKVVKFSDYENVPELKELTAKQEQERASISARIDAGTTTEVSRTSGENVSLRDEITTTRGTPTPIVSNNVTNTSTNNYVPIKADPRPNSRGSALDNYVGRVSTY